CAAGGYDGFAYW
nr:immunoglobulin heavy chain junction region [Mus musculus]